MKGLQCSVKLALNTLLVSSSFLPHSLACPLIGDTSGHTTRRLSKTGVRLPSISYSPSFSGSFNSLWKSTSHFICYYYYYYYYLHSRIWCDRSIDCLCVSFLTQLSMSSIGCQTKNEYDLTISLLILSSKSKKRSKSFRQSTDSHFLLTFSKKNF